MDLKTIIFSVVLCLSSFVQVSWLHECSEGAEKVLKKAPLITQDDLQTCSNVTDVMASVTSLLDTCQFTPSSSDLRVGQCITSCTHSDDCFALTHSTTSGCEFCMDTAGAPGNGNSYDVTRIMVDVSALTRYIDGKNLLFCANL